MTLRARLSLCSLCLSTWLVAVPAHAEVTKDQCVDANASAQRLRITEKLGAARKELLTCAESACPPLVRDDCARRLDELDRAQPTLIFDVKDAAGEDLSDVTVKVDGVSLTSRLDGAPRPVDPGLHVVTFEAHGRATVTRTLVIKEEEKGRRERIVLAEAAGSPPIAEPAPSSRRWGTQRAVGLGMGGLGIAGVAVGAVFGGLATAAWNDQKRVCGTPTSCTAAGHAAAVNDHSTLATDGAVSTAAFIAGGALLSAGAVVFFTAKSRQSSAGVLSIAPSIGSREASMIVRASF